jgi:hypothetical protein
MKTKLQIVALLAIVFASASAQAASITIGDARDTTLYKSQGDRANAKGGVMYAGQDPGGATTSKRGLMGFDIASNIAPGATIQSVQLSLTFAAAAGSGGTPGNGDATARQIDLLRMTTDRAEGTSGTGSPGFSGSGQGFAASAGEATWNNQAHSSTPWDTVGGGGDFESTISASTVVGNPNTNAVFTWGSTSNMVADVQLWLDDPSQNFGWILKANNETAAQSFRAFFTRDATNANFRPSLTITYVPEPGTLTTLLIGTIGLVIVARRAGRFSRSSDRAARQTE